MSLGIFDRLSLLPLVLLLKTRFRMISPTVTYASISDRKRVFSSSLNELAEKSPPDFFSDGF